MSKIQYALDKISLDQLAVMFPSAVVFAVDKNRKIEFWSKGAEKLLGFAEKDLIGQSCLTANRCQQCVKGCGISEHGSIDAYPISLYDAKGKPVEFIKYATAKYNRSGKFNGGIEVLIPVRNTNREEIESFDNHACFHGLISHDPVMQEIFKLVVRVAETDVNVLVRGESGSGKELIAKAIHNESLRKNKPFIALNCASLSSNLLESELFGHVRGAFTDAIRDHTGVIAQAEGGTLFLDEVAEIPLDLQAKLLRVIQEREYTPLGSNKVIKADIRILAATHQSLRKLAHEGKFREDLMYRLRVVPLFLPPLRERKSDIPILLNYFMDMFERNGMRKIREIHPDAMRILLEHNWPGNVRELRNVLEYANAVSRDKILTSQDLPPEFIDKRIVSDYKKDKKSNLNEQDKIKEALLISKGDLSMAAKLLDTSRTTLWRKRKKYKL